jgi:hypothetical protein
LVKFVLVLIRQQVDLILKLIIQQPHLQLVSQLECHYHLILFDFSNFFDELKIQETLA